MSSGRDEMLSRYSEECSQKSYDRCPHENDPGNCAQCMNDAMDNLELMIIAERQKNVPRRPLSHEAAEDLIIKYQDAPFALIRAVEAFHNII